MRYINASEYITIDDVLKSDNIMVIPEEDGVFFINLDPWNTPEEAKYWYRFSTNPFDIDFLKFHIIDQGIITYGVRSFSKIYTLFKYLNVIDNKNNVKYANITNECFFSGLNFKKTIEKYNNSGVHKYHISYNGFINTRNKLQDGIRIWLERLFKEYNNFDNSIEYIQEYYSKWVVLVKFIQTMDTVKQNILWMFIEKENIHSLKDFVIIWKIESKIRHNEKLKGLSFIDIDYINTVLDINEYSKELKE